MNADFINSSLAGYEPRFITSADQNYLDKYWLSMDVLMNRWAGVLASSFILTGSKVRISPQQNVDVMVGGVVFDEDEFGEFTSMLAASGASAFAVVEDIGQQEWMREMDPKFFRFEFPIGISWRDISQSCPIAEDVFLRPIRCFFVIGENARVGKYVDSDSESPHQILFTT